MAKRRIGNKKAKKPKRMKKGKNDKKTDDVENIKKKLIFQAPPKTLCSLHRDRNVLKPSSSLVNSGLLPGPWRKLTPLVLHRNPTRKGRGTGHQFKILAPVGLDVWSYASLISISSYCVELARKELERKERNKNSREQELKEGKTHGMKKRCQE